jgi:hypothetical protein
VVIDAVGRTCPVEHAATDNPVAAMAKTNDFFGIFAASPLKLLNQLM